MTTSNGRSLPGATVGLRLHTRRSSADPRVGSVDGTGHRHGPAVESHLQPARLVHPSGCIRPRAGGKDVSNSTGIVVARLLHSLAATRSFTANRNP